MIIFDLAFSLTYCFINDKRKLYLLIRKVFGRYKRNKNEFIVYRLLQGGSYKRNTIYLIVLLKNILEKLNKLVQHPICD